MTRASLPAEWTAHRSTHWRMACQASTGFLRTERAVASPIKDGIHLIIG